LYSGSEIDQWIDHISSNVAPAARSVMALAEGAPGTLEDKRLVSITGKDLKTQLECFEKHLKLRNFIHGY